MNVGKVVQVIGTVVDCEFEGQLPKVLNALKIDEPGDPAKGIPEIHLVLEVAMHIGENRVRTIAMGSTDGLVRGMKVVDTGSPITVPVGKPVLGRIINVIGEPVDEMGPIQAQDKYPIHISAPEFTEQQNIKNNKKEKNQ